MLHYFLVRFSKQGRTVEHGWMLAESPAEVLGWARAMHYDLDMTYIGIADMKSVLPAVLES
jgi:hypothetical protein